MDLPEARERLPDFRSSLAARGIPVFPISAATGEGMGRLLDAVAQVLSGGAVPTLEEEARPRRRPRAAPAQPRAPSTAGRAVPKRIECGAEEPFAVHPQAAGGEAQRRAWKGTAVKRGGGSRYEKGRTFRRPIPSSCRRGERRWTRWSGAGRAR